MEKEASHYYPAGPESVPPDLTQPAASYKNHVWLAMLGLAAFVLLYLFFAGWFAWTAYTLVRSFTTGGDFFLLIGAACAGFLSTFMIKALFLVRNHGRSEDVEITAADQPHLFGFLYRLADETGAPRPHRVYLSSYVNAAVFYDLSIFNLLWPSKKNLVIGLGLVNVLTLAEFKAVCAHEFGHFAQRSMKVGIWVYIAQQIAFDLVNQRNAWDSFLNGLSRTDLRVAWIGWILRLIVWSVRSLMDSVFRVVVLAQRALSREMEMQADLVAVSVTGSDALIHALYKLQAADEAWDRTLSFLGSELHKKHMTRDAFAIQTRIIEILGRLFDDPTYGRQPAPADAPQEHRVFQAELAQPPRMWSTHPFNHEREANAKRCYITAPLDMRSAWEVFEHPEALREKMTAHLLSQWQPHPEDAALVSLEDSFQHLEQDYDCAYFDPVYQGAYMGRSPVINVQQPGDLYRAAGGENLADELAVLYPETLRHELRQLRTLEKEEALLESLKDGSYTTPDGIIRHRGKTLQRRDLQSAIHAVHQEVEALRSKVCEHDRRCRSVHDRIAAEIGHGWQAYLRGLTAVLHYATHTAANLSDAREYLSRVVDIETVTRKVSKKGLKRVLKAGNELFEALQKVYSEAPMVNLDAHLCAALKIESWAADLGEFELLAPTEDNINNWMEVIDGWMNHALGALSGLRNATLEQLLLNEARVARDFRSGQIAADVPDAPAASTTPVHYATLLPSQERKKPSQLSLWQRFQIADGLLPSLGRFAVAAVFVGSILALGSQMTSVTLVIYNGLSTQVTVQVDGKTIELPADSAERINVSTDKLYSFTTLSKTGEVIETFSEKTGFGNTVYNIAEASPLLEWTQVYGRGTASPQRSLGSSRWLEPKSDVLFEEPPRSVSIGKGRQGATRTVLQGQGSLSPYLMFEMQPDDAARQKMILNHAQWDDAESRYIGYWLMLASQRAESRTDSPMQEILAARLKRNPHDMAALRTEQDMANDDRELHARVCARQGQLAAASPADGNLQYLLVRCMDSGAMQDQAFLDGWKKWPENAFFAYAAAQIFSSRTQWQSAAESFTVASKMPYLAEAAAQRAVRLRRLVARDTSLSKQPQELIERSELLTWLLGVESGESPRDVAAVRAYRLLARGRLDVAFSVAQSAPDVLPHMRWLIAASDGARPAQIQAVLDLPPGEGVNETTVWIAMALAARYQKDPNVYLKAFNAAEGQAMKDEAQTLPAQFLSLIQAGRTAEAEELLKPQLLETRAQAYMMGSIFLGQKAPKDWRDGARYLLFVNERPYFAESSQ